MNNKEFQKRAIRHGEISLIPIDELPGNLKQIYEGAEYIIGHSETGHHHVAVGDITIFQPKGADDETIYLRVNKDSQLKHLKTFDRHETLPVFRGLYMRVQKTAYNYFRKVQERVVD